MGKSNKYAWHNENRVYEGKCESCDFTGKLQIHHKRYHWSGKKKNLYQYSFAEKKEMNLVELLCRTCHLKRHYANSLEEYLEDEMKHSGKCFVCHQTAGKGWARGVATKINKCICKKCIKKIKVKDRQSDNFKDLPKQGTLF